MMRKVTEARVVEKITADITIHKAITEDFDTTTIPGLNSLDGMQYHSTVIDLVKKMHGLSKVLAAIFYGPQLLISANMVGRRQLTASISIIEDMKMPERNGLMNR